MSGTTNVNACLNPSRSLVREQGGSALIYVTVALAVLLGMVGLAIDSGRLMTTSTQAKQAADAAAIAAATQLNGKTNAWDRATKAAMGTIDPDTGAMTETPLVQNRQTLGNTPGNIRIVKIRFLSGLPDGDPDVPNDTSDLDPFAIAADNADRDRLARFAEVTTEQIVQNNWFVRAVGAAPTNSVSAVSVAGFTQTLCRRTPLAICNPLETADNVGAPFDVTPYKGKQFLVKPSGATGGGDSPWTSGNFALVDPTAPDGTDLKQKVKELNKMLAETEPDICIRPRVNLKQGQTQGTRNALNTRFDMYDGDIGDLKASEVRTSAKYQPAMDVTKGRISDGDPCVTTADATKAKALPRDSIFTDGHLGNGKWDCLSYWDFNHKIPGDTTGAG